MTNTGIEQGYDEGDTLKPVTRDEKTWGLLVMFFVNLSGAAGERYGIPYPVFARASMGTSGAKLPAVLRATVAVFWYGVQVYFASSIHWAQRWRPSTVS